MDDRNVVYFANNAGILEYDGTNWQLFRIPGRKSVHSLCYYNGIIYVGAQDDLGYLNEMANGQWEFISLKQYIPDSLQNFKNIWEIVATEDAIFFRSYYAVFKWLKGTMKAFIPKTLFHNAYSTGKDFYVREINTGLKKLVGDSLVFIPGADQFAKQAIAAVLPYKADQTLILSCFDSWFILDDKKIHSYPTGADLFLKTSFIFKAVRLPDDKIAVATQRNGFALLDSNLELLRFVNKNSELGDNTVTGLAFDRQHGVWAGLNKGLVQIKTDPVFSYFT